MNGPFSYSTSLSTSHHQDGRKLYYGGERNATLRRPEWKGGSWEVLICNGNRTGRSINVDFSIRRKLKRKSCVRISKVESRRLCQEKQFQLSTVWLLNTGIYLEAHDLSSAGWPKMMRWWDDEEAQTKPYKYPEYEIRSFDSPIPNFKP